MRLKNEVLWMSLTAIIVGLLLYSLIHVGRWIVRYDLVENMPLTILFAFWAALALIFCGHYTVHATVAAVRSSSSARVGWGTKLALGSAWVILIFWILVNVLLYTNWTVLKPIVKLAF